MTNSVVQAVIKRDRNVVLFGLAVVIGFAAYFTITMAVEFNRQVSLYGEMSIVQAIQYVCGLAVSPGATGPSTLSNLHAFWSLFMMWAVMQLAMMSPTAVPMMLMHTKVERHRNPLQNPYIATAIFFMGYVIVWTIFSAVFAGVQIGLQSANMLSPLMVSSNPLLAGGILIAAGMFQFSKLKEACLNHCRSPVTYLMTDWRDGRGGAVLMGLKHGAHCVGCCWILMALLFVAGVMNILWMAIITVIVLMEKLLPNGNLYGRIAGVGFILWGAAIIGGYLASY